MALNLTVAQLAAAIRVGDSAEETAEVTRIHAYVTEAVTSRAPDAPDAVHVEAAVRLAGYIFDSPQAGRGSAFANAMRNSGAGRALLPYAIHGAGSTAEAVEAAQAVMGSTDIPVVGVGIDAGQLVVTLADGTVTRDDLPAGMTGDGTDETARAAASAAQGAIDAHEASTHNHDQPARAAAAAAQVTADDAGTTAGVAQSTATDAATAAGAAQATADAVRTELTTHETTPHGGGGGTDETARAAASAAQGAIDAHEASTHNHDQPARAAAAAAQVTADDAQTAASAAQADLAAHTSDPNAHHTPPAGGGGGEAAGLEVATAEIRFLRSTPLVEIDSQQFTSSAWSTLQRDGADVVCPTAGQIEVFMQAKSGGRDNSVVYAKIPAPELRLTPTNGEMQIALGANRWFGIRTNSLADQHFQVKGQDGQTSVDGNYSVRISHVEEVAATFVTGVTSGGGGA